MDNPISGYKKPGNPKDASKGRVMKSSGPSVPLTMDRSTREGITTHNKGR